MKSEANTTRSCIYYIATATKNEPYIRQGLLGSAYVPSSNVVASDVGYRDSLHISVIRNCQQLDIIGCLLVMYCVQDIRYILLRNTIMLLLTYPLHACSP